MNYTIKEIANLAGVTTRTLRYYDEIGLLNPAVIGDNGYRYYDQKSLMKLQRPGMLFWLAVPMKAGRSHPLISLYLGLQRCVVWRTGLT